MDDRATKSERWSRELPRTGGAQGRIGDVIFERATDRACGSDPDCVRHGWARRWDVSITRHKREPGGARHNRRRHWDTLQEKRAASE